MKARKRLRRPGGPSKLPHTFIVDASDTPTVTRKRGSLIPPHLPFSTLANSDPYPTMHAKHSLTHYNAELDAQLQAATNGWICVETYKTLRRMALLAGAAIVAATWFLPWVQPSQTALLVFAALILGPEVVEAYLTR